jgi:transposase
MEDPAAIAVLDCPHGWEEPLAELRAEVTALQQEVTRLRRENSELRNDAGYWRWLHGTAVERIRKLEQQVEQLQAEKRQLQQQAFGRRSEKPTHFDKNWLQELEDQKKNTDGTPRRRGQRADQPGPKRRDYSHLPARQEFVELPPRQRCCRCCGKPLAERTDTEDSEQIEIEVKAHRRVIRRKRYQPTCSCTGPWQIVTAPAPPQLIPKSRYGVSVWVEIVLDKFVSQRPTERLLESWRLLGLGLAAGTVNGGLQRLEPLFAPLYEALIARQQQADLWQGDETRWRMFAEQEGKVGHEWWLWVFLSADTVVFVLDASRSRKVPENHLPQSTSGGVMMVDRYVAYKAMAQVRSGQVQLAFCWAHVRRDFIEIGRNRPPLKDWALAWLKRIRELYRQHRLVDRSESSEADRPLRQQVEHLHQQTLTELADASLSKPCRKVLTSLLEHWPGLTRFLDDPRIPLDNNACERQVRGPVVGRKNYYGSGSLWSGRLAAMLFSLFGTLDRCQANPRTWLTGYLQACADAGGRPPPNVNDWLPWQHARAQAE